MSRESPEPISAGMSEEDCAAASDRTPALPVLFQIVGASLGLGRARFSFVCGRLTTPLGRPEVLGVGAWAWRKAAPTSNASRAAAARFAGFASDSRRSAAPTAIQRPAKKVMARYSGRSGATGLAGWRAASTTEMLELC